MQVVSGIASSTRLHFLKWLFENQTLLKKKLKCRQKRQLTSSFAIDERSRVPKVNRALMTCGWPSKTMVSLARWLGLLVCNEAKESGSKLVEALDKSWRKHKHWWQQTGSTNNDTNTNEKKFTKRKCCGNDYCPRSTKINLLQWLFRQVGIVI